MAEWQNKSLRIAEAQFRNAIIEECARVADDLSRIMGRGGKAGAKEIAAAIRALKDEL